MSRRNLENYPLSFLFRNFIHIFKTSCRTLSRYICLLQLQNFSSESWQVQKLTVLCLLRDVFPSRRHNMQ